MKTNQNTPPYRCPICASREVTLFIEILHVPTLCNALWATRENALQVKRGDLRLGFCTHCGHIYNYAFDPDQIAYTQAYENSLHFSPRFQQYADVLADRLINQYDVREKCIIEIGCGKGDFLRSLCAKGNNSGLGFDPGYEPQVTVPGSTNDVTIIQDYYSEQYAHYQADLICCRHVLEHVQDPRSFICSLRRTIKNQGSTTVYFEVPNVLFTLRDLAIWDLIYEHCSYFNTTSLTYLFATSGFTVSDVTETFEGQFLALEAFPSAAAISATSSPAASLRQLSRLVDAFEQSYRAKVDAWRCTLERIKENKQRAVIWGGGSKGITMSNILNVKDQIRYVVDINPRKHGMYIAGTGQCIVPPAFLGTYQPDVVIIMNAIYENEIRQMTKSMGVTPDFVLG